MPWRSRSPTRSRTSSSIASAYNDVDGAEKDPVTALQVNALAVRSLAAAARTAGATLVHYSTDFVFDGEADRPVRRGRSRRTRAASTPSSKLLGEWFALDHPRAYVLRVESLFGEPGPDGSRQGSLKGILVRLRAGEQLPVFVDRTVSPGYTTDIAAATRALVERARRAGHLSLRQLRSDELGGHRGGGGQAARPARST